MGLRRRSDRSRGRMLSAQQASEAVDVVGGKCRDILAVEAEVRVEIAPLFPMVPVFLEAHRRGSER